MTLPVPVRADMFYENGNLVLSGTTFSSPWYETTGINSVRIAAYSFNGASLGIDVMDGQWPGSGSTPLQLRLQGAAGSSGYVNGDFEITGRYFMFELSSGFSGDTCMITVRTV